MNDKGLHLVVLLLVVLSGCRPATEAPTVVPVASAPASALPNPASVYCQEQGGMLQIRQEPSGARGVCIFADGSECEEWAYFRGYCHPEARQTPMPPTKIGVPVPAPTATPAPAGVTPISTEGWLPFDHPVYGFGFDYPPNWTLEEDSSPQSTAYRHSYWLKPAADGNTVLTIGFRHADEADVGIQRTGVGAGDLVQEGTVNFLGQPVARILLRLDGKTMGVLYDSGRELARGDLRFTLGLDYVGEATGETGLNEDAQAVADAIVRSFRLRP